MLAIFLILRVFYSFITDVLSIILCLFSEKYSESFSTFVACSPSSEERV